MKSIYVRNFVAIAATVSICFLAVSLAIIGIGRSYVINSNQEEMVNCAEEVSRTVSAVSEYDSLSGWNIAVFTSTVARATGNQILLSDPSGVVLQCSDAKPVCEHLGCSVPAEVLLATREQPYNQLTDLGGLLSGPRYVVAIPIATQRETYMGFVLVARDADKMLGEWTSMLSIAAIIAMGVFLAAMLFTLFYTRRMARPLDEMAAASRKFAKGDFSPRVEQTADPTDEMGMLIESFNKMADSLEQAEKRRSEFIANISHELRTPMTTISGFADGILDGTIPREDQDKYLLAIRDETRRLNRLVRSMLGAAQTNARGADPSKRTDFDLTELALQTLLSFESRATAKQLDVDPQLPEQHILVHAEKDAITQVIYNLLDNAVKFADKGSCLVLKIFKDNGKAYFSVKDYGETIPPDDLPYIFDRFHKSDRSRSLDKDGVGLGLYLVKAILNSHDEDIAVRSEDGCTEFVFTLPLAELGTRDKHE